MAIFDPILQRMCVRIVYDGAANTGKTTNLRSLCTLFATQQTTEIFSPGEIDGRTLYFDWVQIMAGAVCGFPLMCQIISVPGQAVLTPRRRHLLQTADVVVLVTDSTSHGIDRARDGLALLREIESEKEAGRGAALLIQANKQDQPNARTGKEVAAGLGLDSDEVVAVEAIATEGIGVVDTFVNAVRVVSRRIQKLCEEGDFRIDVGRAPGAESLLGQLETQEVDPEWAAEMLLEEAYAAMLIDGASMRMSTPPPQQPAAAPSEEPVVEVGAQVEEEEMEWELVAGTVPPPPAPPAAPPAVTRPAPLLPQPDVEVGFVWPAHTGRTLLGRLASDLVGRTIAVARDGSACVVVDGHRIVTSENLRFADRELARQGLVRAARERTQIDPRLVIETVLVAQPDTGDAWWLYSITPEAVPLLHVHDLTPELIRSYARVCMHLLRNYLERRASGVEIELDFHPRNFGLLQAGDATSLRYMPPLIVADDAAALAANDDLGNRLAEAVRAFEAVAPDLVGQLLVAIEHESQNLSPAEIAELPPRLSLKQIHAEFTA